MAPLKILAPVKLTAEDAIAWSSVIFRAGPRLGSVVWTRSLMSDTRDTCLMLYMTSHNQLPLQVHPIYVDGVKRVPMPVAHIQLKLDPEWPMGHSMFLRRVGYSTTEKP